MSTPSYIASNIEELLDKAPQDILEMVTGNAVNDATVVLGKLYKLPTSSYIALENIIVFLLVGALDPENAVRAIIDLLGLSQEEATKLAQDLDKTILEKARISILGKSPKDMVTLTFQEGRSAEDLRKEILDTTKRDPVPLNDTVTQNNSAPAPQTPPKKTIITPGSRSQLLDQLQILDAIPDDEEIAARLSKIQEQIKGMNTEDTRALDSNVALQEFMPKGDETVVIEPEAKSATYSKAPTKYNVDPYREVVEG